jgi:superfamily II RNA helicase
MKFHGLSLDPFQQTAIEHIDAGHSVLVAAPTGTGKTLVADYLIEKILQADGEVIYTAPVKALSNQKYREYTEQLGRDKVGLVTGDLVINRDAPVRIMTTEILRNMLLEDTRATQGMGAAAESDDSSEPAEEPDEAERTELAATASPSDTQMPEINRLHAVIIDEIHFLDDPERGTVWEELLIYLPTRIRILGLSATASNLEEMAAWLSAIRETDVKVVREDKRAVPLEMYMASLDTQLVTQKRYNTLYKQWKNRRSGKGGGKKRGSRGGRGRGKKGRGRQSRGRKSRGGDQKIERTRHYHVFEMMQDSGFPALYFIFSRKLVERLAQGLARGPSGRRLARIAKKDEINAKLREFDKQFPGVLTGRTRATLKKGIAWHHAGIHVALKALVEELYEARLINALFCTSTFALGINMPARTVIFDSLTKFNGTDIVPLTVREFMQMAGRAGRRGIDVAGDIIVRQDFDQYEDVRPLLRKLVSEKSEPIESSFNLSFHSVVNLIARFDEDAIRAMLERSFKAFQSGNQAENLRRKISDRQSRMEASALENADELSDEQARASQKHRRKLAALRRELSEEERPRLWEDFQRKLQFLRTHKYLSADNELEPPARILRHIKIEEIFLTELILAGHLEDLDPNELFGSMCALVVTLPRSARIRRPEDDKWWEIFANFNDVYESDVIAHAEALVFSETVFTPEVMPLGERWAAGDALADILTEIQNPTDLSGDLVGAFRRAKDMVGQLRDVFFSDVARRKELTRLIRQVSRDEVEVLD